MISRKKKARKKKSKGPGGEGEWKGIDYRDTVPSVCSSSDGRLFPAMRNDLVWTRAIDDELKIE
jgi:hypothetical protein